MVFLLCKYFLTNVCSKVVKLLDKRNIMVTSVDFVRFTWLIKKADREIEEEEEDNDDDAEGGEDVNYDNIKHIQPVEDGERYYTNPTIWIGVLPNSLTGAVAHESSEDIRAFLESLHVLNVETAYRESTYKTFSDHGPTLYPPSDDGEALKDVIDNVSVPLSIPIASRTTALQGTLGPYFHVGKKLYAITVRHIFFWPDEDSQLYHYNGMFLLDTLEHSRVF